MTTYVLVGGAWIGGWIWRPVAAKLREAGHDVYTPTLTGLGERVHLVSPEIDLETHIKDIVNVMEFEDLTDAVLVGHSYSGFVVTGVADRIPDRISLLAYLGSGVPSDGEALVDGFGEEGREFLQSIVDEHGDGWQMPVWPNARDLAGPITDQQWAWFMARAVPHPFATFLQPLRLDSNAAGQVIRAFLYCTKEDPEGGDYVPEYKSDPDWKYYELETGHWPMITMPDELTAVLLDMAER
ncbi:MAG: alpha/beta fold hydrolase [Chloroflexota bacterium]